jgi:regulator of sigma E protease
MTDSTEKKDLMLPSEGEREKSRSRRILISAALFVIIISLLIYQFGFGFWVNVLIVLLGIGLIIVAHEFGHFITAKLVDMNVEAFSIGFPPTFIGIKRTEKGCRIRILPSLFKKEGKEGSDCEDESSDQGHLTMYLGRGKKNSDTEYRFGLIPFGGYVKIVGQEDVGTAQTSDDPRSYANKAVWQRFLVIVMGVIFNCLLAVVMFMVIFGMGKELPPPVVGGIVPDSPAAKTGLAVGDEIIEIAGNKSFLDFSDIAMAAALSGKGEKIAMMVRHADGSVGRYEIAAEKEDGAYISIRQFGIMQPVSLNISRYLTKDGADKLSKQTGFEPGDNITAVNGTEVKSYWQLQEMVSGIFEPTVTLKAERSSDADGKPGKAVKQVESRVELGINSSSKSASKTDLGNIYTFVPRLKVVEIPDNNDGKFLQGDVIVRIAGTEEPNLAQFRRIVKDNKNKQIPVEVLRLDSEGVERTVPLVVTPGYNKKSRTVALGIMIGPDLSRAAVAETVDIKDGPKGLNIPKGAIITAVNGQSVSSYYDIMKIALANIDKKVKFDWTKGSTESGSAVLSAQDWQAVRPVRSFISDVPFEPVLKLYKAKNFVEAMEMGYKKTWTFILQSYLSIRRIAEGLVGSEELSGPVGIAAISYKVVSSSSFSDFIYLLALISACIGAFNILPILPFDGGLALFLLIEKIKGSPVNERIQNFFATTGWVLVGCFFLYVSFNDIVRFF